MPGPVLVYLVLTGGVYVVITIFYRRLAIGDDKTQHAWFFAMFNLPRTILDAWKGRTSQSQPGFERVPLIDEEHGEPEHTNDDGVDRGDVAAAKNAQSPPPYSHGPGPSGTSCSVGHIVNHKS